MASARLVVLDTKDGEYVPKYHGRVALFDLKAYYADFPL